MATHPRWSPGPAAWKDDLTPLSAADWNADRAAHLLAHAGFGGTPAEIQALADAGLERAVRSLVHYESIPNPRLQPFVESGLWDPSLTAFPESRPEATDRAAARGESMGVAVKPARQPPGAAGVRPLLLLAARHDARDPAARLLVGQPDAADDAPGRAEDGAAVARPLRHPREQGARLPQDGAADRAVRARRHRQPARPDHHASPRTRRCSTSSTRSTT